MDLTVGLPFRRLVPLSVAAVGAAKAATENQKRERRASRSDPCCVECGLVWWPDEEDRFAAHLTDDEPPELAFYCSERAEREFRN
jgi:hypothetical protein